MESAVRQMIYVAFSLAVVSVMIFTASYFTRLARDAERERMTTKALLEQQLDTREWSRYTGAQNGADMLDFILRHKDAYTIVIESTAWDVRLSPYVRACLPSFRIHHFGHISPSFRLVVLAYRKAGGVLRTENTAMAARKHGHEKMVNRL